MSESVAEHSVVEEFSLADLASLNTDEIKALTSRLPMAGIWTVMCISVALSMTEGKPEEDKPALPIISHKFESLKIEPLVVPEDFDISTTVGRKLSDRATIWPDSFKEEIGYVKGKYEKVGLDTKGTLGGLTAQGGEPGWLDNAVLQEKAFKIKVRHGTRNGADVAYLDWVGPADEETSESEAA